MGRLKKYFSAFCGVALVFSVSAAQSEAGGPYIKKHSSPPSVKLDEPPKLDDANSFSMILLGDPQSYVKFDFNQPLFEFMTAWCAAQKDKLNVKTVLCTGDLVEQTTLSYRTEATFTADRNAATNQALSSGNPYHAPLKGSTISIRI